MDDSVKIVLAQYVSPCGVLALGSYCGRLCMCDWTTEKHHASILSRLKRNFKVECADGMTAVIADAMEQLDEYFGRQRRVFDIPMLFTGTDFQKEVWNSLLDIPYGHTISYRELANSLGRPAAVRAVANANGANSLSIFAPCHRVIGSDGTLTGYGGGLEAKEYLLALEGNSLGLY